MNQNYKLYANRIKNMNEMFAKAIEEKNSEINEILNNKKYSDFGKNELKERKIDELKLVCDNMNKLFKETVRHFCEEYTITIPKDDGDHSTDIQNALRIIEMLGENIDRENIENAIRPLEGSFTGLKTVFDLLKIRTLQGEYSEDVRGLIYEYIEKNNVISDYISIFGNIDGIIQDNNIGYSYSLYYGDGNTSANTIEMTPYRYLCCGDWMIEAGEMYNQIETEFPTLFQKRTPTNGI